MQPESAAGRSDPSEDGSPFSCESHCLPASRRLLPERAGGGRSIGMCHQENTLSPWKLTVPQTAVRDPLATVSLTHAEVT